MPIPVPFFLYMYIIYFGPHFAYIYTQVSTSYVEGRTSLEEYISYMKSTVGLGVLVEAVSIGKEKGDLTRLSVEPGKNSQAFSAPTCKALSSLGPSGIMQSLTGRFRLSKSKSNEIFWEAVWPRLLARGWHSEKPKNRGYVTSKDYLVFPIPGIQKFSRRKLVKGDHYFDSVSDVLSKVVAEPNILELEEEAKVGSCNEEEPQKRSNGDDLSDYLCQCRLNPRSSTYKKDHIKCMVIDTTLLHGEKPSDLMELKSVPINSVHKVEVDAANKRYKGKIYTRKLNHSKDMSNSKQKSTKSTVIDTNRLLKVKRMRYPPVEFEDASTMTTGLLRQSKGVSSTDDLPRMVESEMLICGKMKINETDSCRGVSKSKKEAYELPDNDANKMVNSKKNQHAYVFDDNRLKRIKKHQFNWRVRSCDSNHAAVPIKRRRLTACAKAEKSCIIENSSGGLGSDKLRFSRSSSFLVANKNVCDPISHQQNESSTDFSTDRSVEENKEKSICNGNYQYRSGYSAPNDDEVVILTKAKHEWLLQRLDRADKLEGKILQILNLQQKHQKNSPEDINRKRDEAVIKKQQAEEKKAEEIKVKQAEAAKVKEMQEAKALASSYGNQLTSTFSAPNDDEVVFLTKEKYEWLLQRLDQADKLEGKILQILNLQPRKTAISDRITTQKEQLLNL